MTNFDYRIIIAAQYEDHLEVKYARRFSGRAMALLQELVNAHQDVVMHLAKYEPDGFKKDWREQEGPG